MSHPFAWFLITAALCSLAITSSNPLLLAGLAVVVALSSILTAGPRRYVMVLGLGGALLALAAWGLLTLVLPAADDSPIIAELPTLDLGTGITWGGPISLGALSAGLTRGLRAAVVILTLALAGQVISARGWMALAQATAGPLTPLVAPLCCLPETSSTVIATRDRLSWPRRWMAAAQHSSEALWSVSDLGPSWARVLRVVMVICLGLSSVAGISGIASLIIAVAIVMIFGMALPGCPGWLRRWYWSDLVLLVAAGALIGLLWADSWWAPLALASLPLACVVITVSPQRGVVRA